MTPGLWLGIAMMCFMIFGVPEERKPTVTITAIRGTIEVIPYGEKPIEVKEGRTIIISDDGTEWETIDILSE